MASIDPRYSLAGVVTARSGKYVITDRDPGSYLIPKRSTEITTESLHQAGRGIAYAKSAFAYLFQRRNA